MKLAPKMIQSMEILQLPALALEERIEKELEANVALEIAEPEGPSGDSLDGGSDKREGAKSAPREREGLSGENADSFARLGEMERRDRAAFDNEYTDNQRIRRIRGDGDGDPKLEAMANTAAPGETLTEQLLRQWSFAEVSEAIRDAGRHLISYIDDDGFLRTDLDSIARQAPAGVTLEAIREAVPEVQRWLEPPGVGARNLRECLLLQLDALDREDPHTDRSVERWIVEDYLDDVEANRLPRIAQQTDLTLDEIKAALDRLKSLDPRPGRLMESTRPEVVVPDAWVEFDESSDTYVCGLYDGRLPQLRLNADCVAIAKDKQVDGNTREFVGQSVRNATWLIEAIEQRNHTLLRVVKAVVSHQRDFFDLGAQSLKPLPMTQVADQLGIHVATVSRAVNGKWIQTPRGVLPLRKFFTAGTETESGEDMSWDAVKQVLKEILDSEDKSNPMGDDALAAELKKRGITLARRTVAKYRDQLGVPSARLRRTF